MKEQHVKTSRKLKNAAVTTAIAASVMLGSVATPVLAAEPETEEPLLSETESKRETVTKSQVDEAKKKMETLESQKTEAEEKLAHAKEEQQLKEDAAKDAYTAAIKGFEEERDAAEENVALL